MDHAKKLDFIHKMTKLGLQHYDSGGVIQGSANPGVSGAVASGTSTALSPVTGVLSGVSQALTTQNQFNANAPTQIGTVGAQQATLAQQLQQEAAGGGPNPAQIQYEQNANAIAQRAAAQNAQNRAINPGLAARQSSNAAVQAGQEAAGGAAAQQAQQQITAQQQLAGLTGQEQTGALNAQGINAQTAQANANAVNNTEGGLLGGISSVLGLAKGGEIPKYDSGGPIAPVFQVPNFSAVDSGAAAMPTFGFTAPSAGIGSSDSSGNQADAQEQAARGNAQLEAAPEGAVDLNMYGGNNTTSKARGGEIRMAYGGEAPTGIAIEYPSSTYADGGAVGGPRSFVGRYLTGMSKGGQAKGRNVPAMVSPGEIYLTPGQSKAVADGKANALKVGEKIKGKAKVRGDSEKNDIVPKLLKAGGEVLTRSVVSKRDPKKAADFVRAHMTKRKMG